MSAHRSVLALLASMLLLGLPCVAQASEQQLVSMLRIIPRSPGGPGELPLPLAQFAEPGFYFELGISDELGNSNYDEYISRRLNLLNAGYTVELSDHGTVESYRPGGDGTYWTSVAAAQGVWRIPASLLPGHVYSWVVVASVDDGGGSVITVRSQPLYFHTAGSETLLTADGPAAGRGCGFANGLALLAWLQQSEEQAVSRRVQGSASYVNYPLATDSYICSSIDEPGSRPLPAPDQSGLLELPDLLQLGAIMREAHELHSWISAGRDPLGQVRSLSNNSRLFVNALATRQASPLRGLDSLQGVARRLGVEEAMTAQEQLSLLSELLLLGDQLVGSGTYRAAASRSDALSEYAYSSDRRLRQLSDMDPGLFALLGPEQGRFWQEFFRSQRAELALLREDIRNGSLDDSGLPVTLQQAGERARVEFPAAFNGNEKGQYAEALSAFAKLAPAGRDAALQELLEAQLSAVASSLWPRLD